MYTFSMLTSRFDDLRRRKAYREGRDLTLRTVAAESGLALTTIIKVKRGDLSKLHVSTLESLCDYFDVKSIADLVEYTRTPQEPPSSVNERADTGQGE